MPNFYNKTKDHRRQRLSQQSLRGTYRYVRWRWRLLFAVIDAVGWSIVWPLRKLLGRGNRGPLDSRGVQRILIVQLDHLGDAVISLRTLHCLRHRFPQAAIDVLCSPWAAELFTASAHIRDVHVSRNNRFCRPRRWTWWCHTLQWGIRLRCVRYDVAFDVRGEAPLAALLWLSGARRRVGWNCGGGGFLLTHSAAYENGRSEFQSRIALWSAIALDDERQEPVTSSHAVDMNSCIDIDDSTRRRIKRRLAVLGHRESPRVVLHLGAGTAAKRWPVERWRALIEHLATSDRCTLIVVGTRDEKPLASVVTTNHGTGRLVDWTGELSVIELAGLLEQADLFVGADSGPAHLAAAMRTPTVVLFSGTNRVQQWQPVGKHVRVVRHDVACGPCHRTECAWFDHPCMRGISPHEVVEAIEDVLIEYRVATERDSCPKGDVSRRLSLNVPTMRSV